MARHGVVLAGLVLTLLLGPGGSSPAGAQLAGDGVIHRVGVQYWAATGTPPAPASSWSSGVFRLEYTGLMRSRPFGLSAQYLTGGGMGESFWTINLSYEPMFRTPSLAAGTLERRVFTSLTAGYASFRWTVGGAAATSSGFGLGFNATVLLGEPKRGGRVALLADYTTYPNNVTSGPGSVGSGPASVWSIAIRYKLPSRMASGEAPGTTYVSTLGSLHELGADWDATAGVLGVDAGGYSTYHWSGFFVGIGKTF